jgi:hypothetical protein
MLHWHQVWKHIRKLTNRDVEKGAIIELYNDIENRTDNIIHQSIIEFDSLNTNRIKQGLPEKVRIDRECIQRAIKSINNDILTSLSERTGGIIQKEKGEKNVEHKPETKDLGVEII